MAMSQGEILTALRARYSDAEIQSMGPAGLEQVLRQMFPDPRVFGAMAMPSPAPEPFSQAPASQEGFAGLSSPYDTNTGPGGGQAGFSGAPQGATYGEGARAFGEGSPLNSLTARVGMTAANLALPHISAPISMARGLETGLNFVSKNFPNFAQAMNITGVNTPASPENSLPYSSGPTSQNTLGFSNPASPSGYSFGNPGVGAATGNAPGSQPFQGQMLLPDPFLTPPRLDTVENEPTPPVAPVAPPDEDVDMGIPGLPSDAAPDPTPTVTEGIDMGIPGLASDSAPTAPEAPGPDANGGLDADGGGSGPGPSTGDSGDSGGVGGVWERGGWTGLSNRPDGSIRGKLHENEFVVNAPAAAKAGPFLEALNRNSLDELDRSKFDKLSEAVGRYQTDNNVTNRRLGGMLPNYGGNHWTQTGARSVDVLRSLKDVLTLLK